MNYTKCTDHFTTLGASIDNGDACLAELKIAIEKVVEFDNKIAVLTKERDLWRENYRVSDKNHDEDTVEFDKQIAVLKAEIAVVQNKKRIWYDAFHTEENKNQDLAAEVKALEERITTLIAKFEEERKMSLWIQDQCNAAQDDYEGEVKKVAALTAANERLREALENLLPLIPWVGRNDGEGWVTPIGYAYRVAKAEDALKQPEPGGEND